MAGEAHPLRSGRCERARQWVSLRADGELTELEDALLENHLEACGPCRSFAARLTATTELVRETPLERPEIEYAPRARRPAGFPVGRRVAIVAVAAAAALGSFVGSSLQKPGEKPGPASVPQVSFLTRDMAQLRQLPHQTKQAKPKPTRVPGEPPEGVV
jgi:ferric-dicitrate binding protein FerR (iron transport regulator)